MRKQTAITALLGTFVVSAMLGTARDAAAAACCMSATSGGVGRLLIWEKAAVGLRLSPTVSTGFWSPEHDWYPWEDYSDVELRSTLWGIARLSRRASVQLSLPVVGNLRRAGELEDRGVGVGDVSVGARYEIVSIGELLGVPAIAVQLGLVAPTGRSADEGRGDLAADVTGRGAWTPSVGASFEMLKEPFFVRADLGGAFPLPYERADGGGTLRHGESLSAALTGGYEITQRLVVDLTVRAQFDARTVQDGERVADTSRTDFGLGPGLSWRALDHWTFTLGGDTGVFVDGPGRNQQGRVTGTLGVRYGIF